MELFHDYCQNTCSKRVVWTGGTHLAVCDSHHDEQSGVLAVDQFEVLIFHKGTLGRAERLKLHATCFDFIPRVFPDIHTSTCVGFWLNMFFWILLTCRPCSVPSLSVKSGYFNDVYADVVFDLTVQEKPCVIPCLVHRQSVTWSFLRLRQQRTTSASSWALLLSSTGW